MYVWMDGCFGFGVETGGREGERAWHSQHEGRSEPDYILHRPTDSRHAIKKEKRGKEEGRRERPRVHFISFDTLPATADWGGRKEGNCH